MKGSYVRIVEAFRRCDRGSRLLCAHGGEGSSLRDLSPKLLQGPDLGFGRFGSFEMLQGVLEEGSGSRPPGTIQDQRLLTDRLQGLRVQDLG